MKKYKEIIELGVFGITVFIFLFLFFTKIHPMIIFDTDDWLYIYANRQAIPLWGNWNPTRIFPEVFMPFFSQIGATLFYPSVCGYIESLILIHGLVVSLFVLVYVMEFVLLMKDRLAATNGESILLGTLFLLFHFLIFRKSYNWNFHLFYSANVTCYYYYVLPELLNCILVMQFMRKDIIKEWWNNENLVKKGLAIVCVYFAIFSNLFSSVILIAYVGTMLVWDLASRCRKRQFQWSAYIRENGIRLIVIMAWLVAQIFEMNGGRADSIGSGSLWSGIVSAWKAFWNWKSKINFAFIGLTVVVIVVYMITIVRKRKSDSAQTYFPDICKLLLSMGLTLIYLLLLCAKVSGGYIARCDVILAIAFWGLLIIGICMHYLMNRHANVIMMMPLLIVILCFETNTSGNTFADINFAGLPYEVCLEIDNDVIDQFVTADQKGATEMVLYVPDFGSDDNWPIATYAGNRFSSALSKHGVISKTLYVIEVIPSKEKNEQFHLED